MVVFYDLRVKNLKMMRTGTSMQGTGFFKEFYIYVFLSIEQLYPVSRKFDAIREIPGTFRKNGAK